MKRSLIIMSGDYVEPELRAEFGRIPPALLPLAGRRLVAHQHEAFEGQCTGIFLSLPEDHVLGAHDARHAAEHGIGIVRAPLGLSLGQSVVFAMKASGATGPLAILHGDTLYRDYAFGPDDAVSLKRRAPSDYGWAHARLNAAGDVELLESEAESGPKFALTGVFEINDPAGLALAIGEADGSFIRGLERYGVARPLKGRTDGEWLDFGHSGTYHRSRQRFTTQRSFNQLEISGHTVEKSGDNSRKIEAEAQWFETLPAHLRCYAPTYLGRGARTPSYRTEYQYLPTLADLYVFGNLPTASWERVFAACNEFLTLSAAVKPADGQGVAEDLYLPKTMSRLERFAAETGISLDAPAQFDGQATPSLSAIATVCAARVSDASRVALVHGDFCFSNILYNARADLIKVIDPRGLDAAERPTLFGDPRYDIAKLHHSVVGRYDEIIAGRFSLSRAGPLDMTLALEPEAGRETIQAIFLATAFAGVTPDEAQAGPIAILLFLSMLPLHADNPVRQGALLANALRLFLAMDW